MEHYITGQLVRSLAGHDKGSLMVILRTDEQHVYVADGKRRTVDFPKPKNRKHVQPINRYLDGDGPWTNEQIKRFLAICMKEN